MPKGATGTMFYLQPFLLDHKREGTKQQALSQTTWVSQTVRPRHITELSMTISYFIISRALQVSLLCD